MGKKKHLEVKTVKNQKLKNGLIYSGTCLWNDKYYPIPNGYGQGLFSNGHLYRGEWINGKMSGKGQLIQPKIFDYNGEFLDGNMNGQGRMLLKAGNIKSMEGIWKDNELNGFGCVDYFDGSRYIGEFQHFTKHGRGRCLYSDGSIFSGVFVKGKKNGFGKMKYSDSSVYIGHWLDDMRHGFGFYVLLNGDYYSGYWMNNKKNGNGIYYSRLYSCAIDYVWHDDTRVHISRSYHY
jgi:hypothetical protein